MKSRFFDDVIQPQDDPSILHDLALFAQHWRWIFASGLVYFVLGFIAFNIPPVSTVSMTFTLAGLLVVSGSILLAQAIGFRHHHGSVTRLFQSMLSFVIASLMFQYPYAGLEGLSLALSFYFLIGAVLKWIFAAEMRPHAGWSWDLVSSIVSFALGLYIVAIFPFKELWAPGALLGLELMISGSGILGFALSVQKYQGDLNKSSPSGLQRDQGFWKTPSPTGGK